MPAHDKEWKKEYNRQYHAKARQTELARLQAIADIEALQEKGGRYRSECLSAADLGKIYFGESYKEIAEEEDDDDSEVTRREKKLKKKALKPPNPSKSEILGEQRTFQEWLDLRDKARKDLFWLGATVLKKDFVATTHQDVCDQFVQKNFDGAFPEGYTLADVHKAIGRQVRVDNHGNPTKEMVLLYPRGFMKSSIDGVDCVQWMLNVPDIRILILTGEYKLAVSFMREIKRYLFLVKGDTPSDLQLLFPEYTLQGREGASKEPFTLNCRKHNQREATLWVNSIEANLAGWHCDVKKGDDVVTDENSNTPEAREKLKMKYDGTNNLLDEWGFSDHIGTRYFGDPDPDWYGTRLRNAVEEGNSVKYFCRACWTVKPGFANTPLKELTEDMVTLTFPEKASFKSLRKKLLENERSFRNQQLNEPAGSNADLGFRCPFDEDDLRSHIVNADSAPKHGDVFICWDWALSSGKRSDYTVGVVGRVYQDNAKFGIIVLEVVYGKWRASEIAYNIVALEKKWHPKKTLIEKSNGAELLDLELRRQATKYNVSFDPFWKQPSLEAHAKRNRIKGLETLLKDDRLWFVAGNWIDDTFNQMIRYTGEQTNRGRHDDIPDAMSYLCFYLPKSAMVTDKDNEDLVKLQKQQMEIAARKANYDRIFGSGSTTEPIVEDQEPVQDARRAALQKIFGGNGIRV